MVKFSNFKFLYPSDSDNREEVFKQLLSEGQGNEMPARRILDLILPGGEKGQTAHCQTVIVEDKYIDSDYVSSYVRHYFHAYRDYGKRCKRIHFFGLRVQEQDLLNLSKDQRESYLGFVVVRPTVVFKIGRTMVAPELAYDNKHFLLCECECPVNLAGNELKILGAIFMQQDTQVAACTTAAIWMAQSILAYQLGLPRHTTTQITEMATRSDVSVGRAIPSPGLNVSQMLEAIRSMGYDPITYNAQGWYEQRQTIYRYVESRIPVIINLAYPGREKEDRPRYHALVIVGHSYALNTSPTLHAASSIFPFPFYPSIEWIPSFLANDDNKGPYRSIEILNPADKSNWPVEALMLESLWAQPISFVKVDQSVYNYSPDSLYAAIATTIVALPKGVSLTAEKAEVKARRLIAMLCRIFDRPYPKDLVLRTFLQSSNEFKARLDPELKASLDPELKASLDPELKASDELKARYRNLIMPKFIWVTEISTKKYMNEENPYKRLLIGEIIIDSCATPWSEDFIAIHIITGDFVPHGLFVSLDPDTDDPIKAIEEAVNNKSRYIEDDIPYNHLVRPPVSECSP